MNKSLRRLSWITSFACLLLTTIPFTASTTFIASSISLKPSRSNAELVQTELPGCYTRPNGTLMGRMVGANNEPIEGYLIAELDHPSGFRFYGNADSTGAFTTTLPEGNYRVLFNKSYFSPQNYVNSYYDDQPSARSAALVSVTANQTTTINTQFRVGGLITGTVVGRDHSPGGSTMRILILAADGGIVSQLGSNPYTSPPLLPGVYKIWVLPPSDNWYPTANHAFYGDSYDFAHAAPITVTAGQTISNVDIEVDAESTLSVTFTAPISYNVGQASLYATSIMTFGPANNPVLYPYTKERVFLAGTGFSSAFYLPSGNYRLKFVGRYVGLNYYNDQPAIGQANLLTIPLSSTNAINYPLELNFGWITGTVSVTDTFSHPDSLHIELYDPDTGEFVANFNEYGLLSMGYQLSYPFVFESPGLRSGRYKIRFAASSNRYPGYVDNWYPDKTTFADASVITVSTNTTLGSLNANLKQCPYFNGESEPYTATPTSTTTATPTSTSTPVASASGTSTPEDTATITATPPINVQKPIFLPVLVR